MTRRFTGRHMAMLFIGFFGVVIAVNLFMARSAISTFGGTVVENSYVASQKFNGWIAQGRAQQQAGWLAGARRDAQGHVVVTLGENGKATTGATMMASGWQAGGERRTMALAFVPAGDGTYRSTTALPAGRWTLNVEAHKGRIITRHRIELP